MKFKILAVLYFGLFVFAFSERQPFAYDGGHSEQKLLVDFSSKDEGKNWRIINDGVMGGLSQSEIVIQSESTAVFRGTISLKNNGGFASVRTFPSNYELIGFDGLTIRVKGDGKEYQVRLRTDNHFDGITYKAHFQTVAEKWVTVHIDFDKFTPSYRGRSVPDAPALMPSKIRQIGFLIAEKQEGPFRLEIDWIKAYKE